MHALGLYLKKGNYLSLSIPYLVFLKNACLMPNSQLCPEVKKSHKDLPSSKSSSSERDRPGNRTTPRTGTWLACRKCFYSEQ